MSTIKVNTITKRTGSTLTLGESGTTVAIASGASTSGMGRSGTVDWQTSSIKTATFTAVNGQGFFANTSGGTAFNMNLPAGSAGAIVSVADYSATFQTTNLILVPNGSDKIGSVNANLNLNTQGQSVTFVYVDATQGWINTMDSTSNERANDNLIASGGNTVVVCGDYKIHVFTSPGNFVVSDTSVSTPLNKADYVVVAGGGGGAVNHGGAGGAGGYRESPGTDTSYTSSPLGASPATSIVLSSQSYPIVIGGGGATNCSGSTNDPTSRKGSNSTALGITATGGGGGGAVDQAGSDRVGGPGGSAGSGGSNGDNPGGNGNTPPVNPSQGNNGGNSVNNPQNHSGGGGGASAVGANGGGGNAGNGGAGTSTQIINPSNPSSPSFGSPAMNFSGGGGGGSNSGGARGSGGSGGGGQGSVGGSGSIPSGELASAGVTNAGGGGGGTGRNVSTSPNALTGLGGSGIVMIRYKFQ
tara:strand:+ start:5045 stop:6454 length:1410 start_codon:yes stop_codon:yes gene_type:complete